MNAVRIDVIVVHLLLAVNCQMDHGGKTKVSSAIKLFFSWGGHLAKKKERKNLNSSLPSGQSALKVCLEEFSKFIENS